MTTDLLERHRALLVGKAVRPEIIQAAGVRSVERPDQLPEGVPGYWANYLPGWLIPWQMNGHREWQLAPDDRTKHKYLFREGADVPLNQLRDPGHGPIILVEGTKQSLSAASYAPEHWAVYGVTGCWGWQGTNISFAAGREVVVVFDADRERNRDVWDASKALKEALELVGAEPIRFANVPGSSNQGLDDFLGSVDEQLRGDVLARMLERADQNLGKAPAKKKANASPWFGDNGLLVETLVKAIFEKHPAALSAEDKIALYIDGAFRIHRTAFLAAVAELLGEDNRPAFRAAAEEHMIGLLESTGRRLPDRVFEPLLNVTNGMLDLTTGKLYPHDPKYLSVVQYPVPWDPSATSPHYDAWLEQVIGDQIEDLEEVAAQMLDPSRTPAKAMLAYGPSRSGKSTFLRLLEAVAGSENTSAVSLHQLVENRFAAAHLYGKALNTSADLSARHVDDLSIFKMVTGEDTIHGDRKHGNQFSFVSRALFAFSANELPTVGESSRAYAERIKPFQFKSSFAGHEDPRIEDAMRTETSGILLRLVRAWQRRNERGVWLSTPETVQSDFEQRSDRVRQWVSEECSIWVSLPDGVLVSPGQLMTPDKVTRKRELAQSFNRWADRNGGTKMGERKIIDRLTSINGVVEVRRSTDKNPGLNVTVNQDGNRSGVDSVTFASPSPMALSKSESQQGQGGQERVGVEEKLRERHGKGGVETDTTNTSDTEKGYPWTDADDATTSPTAAGSTNPDGPSSVTSDAKDVESPSHPLSAAPTSSDDLTASGSSPAATPTTGSIPDPDCGLYPEAVRRSQGGDQG